MNSGIKGKIAWHNGDAIELSGETESKYGVEWYLGTYLVGHKAGENAVVVSTVEIDDYSDVAAIIEEERRNYAAFAQALAE